MYMFTSYCHIKKPINHRFLMISAWPCPFKFEYFKLRAREMFLFLLCYFRFYVFIILKHIISEVFGAADSLKRWSNNWDFSFSTLFMKNTLNILNNVFILYLNCKHEQ